MTTYTLDEAAAILEETPERVREMLQTGDLDGIPPGATLSGEWKVLLPSNLGEESPETSAQEDQGEPPGEESEQFVEPPDTPPADAEEPSPVSEELARGDNAASTPEPTAPSGWVSTQQAARALGISARTVRWHIEQGNLVAKPQGEGVRRSWLVSIDSVHAFRDARQAAGEMPRTHRASAETTDIAAHDFGNAIRVLAERLEEAAARAAEYRTRLELTTQAESSLRAELEEARRRQAEAERERDEVRRELEALRARPPDPRESPVSPGPSATPAEATRGPQTSPQPTQRRRGLWRRVFGG